MIWSRSNPGHWGVVSAAPGRGRRSDDCQGVTWLGDSLSKALGILRLQNTLFQGFNIIHQPARAKTIAAGKLSRRKAAG